MSSNAPGFINWERYLRANQQTADQMVGKTAQDLQARAEKAQAGAAEETKAFGGAVAAAAPVARPTVNLAADETGLKEQRRALSRYSSGKYEGPMGLSEQAQSRIRGDVTEAQRRYAMAGSSGGQRALLSEVYGGAPARSLDVGLMQSSGLPSRIEQLSERYAGLGGLLDRTRQSAKERAEQAAKGFGIDVSGDLAAIDAELARRAKEARLNAPRPVGTLPVDERAVQKYLEQVQPKRPSGGGEMLKRRANTHLQ
jgi:hypothetical protein